MKDILSGTLATLLLVCVAAAASAGIAVVFDGAFFLRQAVAAGVSAVGLAAMWRNATVPSDLLRCTVALVLLVALTLVIFFAGAMWNESAVLAFLGRLDDGLLASFGWYPRGADVWLPAGLLLWFVSSFLLCVIAIVLAVVIRAFWLTDKRQTRSSP